MVNPAVKVAGSILYNQLAYPKAIGAGYRWCGAVQEDRVRTQRAAALAV